MTPYNLQEVKYAIQYSENLSLKTKFLYFYDEFKFNQEIFPRFLEFLGRIKRVRWFNVSPYVISTFLPGTYITGTMDPWSSSWCEDHNKGIYDIAPKTYNEDLYLYDYDFYTVKECDNFYAPLAYTPEVFFNMIREMDFSLSCVAAKAELYRVPERKKIDVVLDKESKIFKNSMWLRNKLMDAGYDVDQKETFIGTKTGLLKKYMK
jgi:hypothetical protein